MKKPAILLAFIIAFSAVVACQKQGETTASTDAATASTVDSAKPAEAFKKDATKK